jgi:protein SCO1
MRRQALRFSSSARRAGFVLAAALAALLAGCGSSSSSHTNATSASSSYRAEATLTPPAGTPPLKLRNYVGQPVDIDQYRGKAVLVTFIYTHCPDVCPLITANLRVAQNLLGAKQAAKAQIIAVSVDAKGDTRKTVAAFLAAHEMTGRMQYLIGSQQELARVWKAWGVGSERDAHNPGVVEHSGLVYGITGSGKRAVLYSASFKPADVAHDVPLLAAH